MTWFKIDEEAYKVGVEEFSDYQKGKKQPETYAGESEMKANSDAASPSVKTPKVPPSKHFPTNDTTVPMDPKFKKEYAKVARYNAESFITGALAILKAIQ